MSEATGAEGNHNNDAAVAAAAATTQEEANTIMASGRARRKAAKRVDYAKEQEFSDQDNIFEDSEDDAPPPVPTSSRSSRGRPSAGRGGGGGGGRRSRGKKQTAAAAATSTTPAAASAMGGAASAMMMMMDLQEDHLPQVYDDNDMTGASTATRPVYYTEKGYDPSLPPIRERFPFLPEYEEDGSPKIELIVGRRPVDEKEDNNNTNGKNDTEHDDKNDNKEEADDNDEDTANQEDEDGGGSSRGSNTGPRRRGRQPTKASSESSNSPQRNQKRNNNSSKKKGSATKSSSTGSKKSGDATANSTTPTIEYEYLVKYKGRSYLHLEWKTGADLESMNKSAKGIYRRYLKKLEVAAVGGGDTTLEELESPEFDPSFIVPEKILDQAEQEITVELSDKELLRWEKEREKEMAAAEEEEEDDDNDDNKNDKDAKDKENKDTTVNGDNKENPTEGVSNNNPASSSSSNNENLSSKEQQLQKVENAKGNDENVAVGDDWDDVEDLDLSNVSLDRLRAIAFRDGPYYPVVEGSNNPYRDGHIKEPPKKPRASYLFFQCCLRTYYQKRNPKAPQSEIMTLLGDAWRNLSDKEKEPFVQLAKEEMEQFEKEKTLMEKAQRPNEVWQPLRRCSMVLDRLKTDSFADIFLEPVDTEEFTDYEDIIDNPMDLGTVRTKLDTKKYQAPEQFARDMRRVWNNCKIYNQHGSAIWHVADYMSKLFERLYHAWVLEFRERYLRWSDPRARPWEHSCRLHDGKCGTPDDQMVLCDHCDAMYGFACLNPPLKKAPKKAWHCPDCKPKLKSVKGIRMLSAVAEHAARKRAELGDLPKKKIKQSMYLVKWDGLGFEFCTWETREDINDDELIAQYHRLNDTFVDEVDMPEEVLDKFLESTKHVHHMNAGGISCMPSLRSQLYAQTRAFQFAKCGIAIPDLVCSECGPHSEAAHEAILTKHDSSGPIRLREVVECLSDMVLRVERNLGYRETLSNTALPPPLTGEYDVVIPITSKGLMLNVGEMHGAVAFLGYRAFPDGSKGPAEIKRLIRNVGDKIIAVDGVSTVGKTFKDVIAMLRESGKNKFAYMRFLENRYVVCEGSLASVGTIGRYAVEELQRKFTSDRQRVVVQRTQKLIEADKNEERVESLESVKKGASDEESDVGSEGEFQPDSDDEDPDGALPSLSPGAIKESKILSPQAGAVASDDPGKQPSQAHQKDAFSKEVAADQNDAICSKEVSTPALTRQIDDTAAPPENVGEGGEAFGTVVRQETTRSLAFRLLDLDVGYSSDEGGDENCVYYMDGVDATFTRKDEVPNFAQSKKPKVNVKKEKGTPAIPARQTEFAALGERAKLVAAATLTLESPNIEDFDHFPYPSSKELEAIEKQQLEAQLSPSPSKNKRSTVKVEQVSLSTGDVIHVWANVESASATLQLPLNQLRQVLRGEYDEELGDEVGGYKWRYALAGAKVTAGTGTAGRGGGGKKAKEAWLEFRDKLYDPAEPHIYKNGNRLRDYQVDGVNWLASTWYKRQGCILADEMGLGKTVQIVCYIEHLFRIEKIKRPYLVVVPLSTVEHWRREFEGWTDMVCCVYHDRQRIWRDVLREYEWYFKDRPHTPEFLKFDVLVTTYDTLIGDFDVISQIPFRVAVVDEAHRLRNQKGKLLECMREIAAKGTMQHGFQSRVLMSGTPLQNDLTELWTLLNFIEPFKFPDLDDFLVKFGNMANRQQVESLQQMISPFMLRRVKEDVAKDIPAKEETVIDVELTSIQKQYYRAIFEHNHAFLNMGSSRQTAPKLMNIQMELRKVCNHPFLLEGIEHRETERQYKEFQESGKLEGKSPEEQQYMLNEHGYVMTSGKMVLLDKLLPKLRQEGHKVLIFSQMVKMLDLISEYCELRDYPYERLDGRIRGTERQKSIDRFEREKNSFLFLLSTRAGGVGINLTAADICILFDSDWNPQNDVQAQARCHRIGQTKDVRIYRLVTSRSFEQEMFDRASRKLGLEQAVLGTFEKEKEDDKPSHEEMEQLLKKGAYALLEDDNDQITQQFCADDIDSILAKRTRTRVVEGAKTSAWLNKQGMMVSKSRFTAEEGDQLDMDDPLFWQKVMPNFLTPSILLQKLNELTDEIEGTKRGPGRGRWRQKRKLEEEAKMASELKGEEKKASEEESQPEKENIEGVDEGAADEGAKALLANETLEEMSEDDIVETSEKGSKTPLSRAFIKKVNKFMTDLKSLVQSIVDEEDEALTKDEKDHCQKLLLTVSVKEKIFTEEQRLFARSYLKRLEGDRKRRCRTSEQPRFTPGVHDDEPVSNVPEELLIRGRKKRKKRKRVDVDEEEVEPEVEAEADETPKRPKRTGGGGAYVGEDGYLHHSDSEADWSDVGEDLYHAGVKKRDRISRKEAHRRRSWATDDDAATAAGRPWPVFPRHVVKNVLSTVLESVMKYDKEKGGVFSAPVSKEDFPEYYEQIKQPMDYSTIKTKLENGEYRSAQAMQKDFVLILQNCREFNAPSSDIVKEARRQHLLRPKFLKEAALKHDLFLAEDGTVLEIFDEEKKGSAKKKGRPKSMEDDGDADGEGERKREPNTKKKGKAKKSVGVDKDDDVEQEHPDGRPPKRKVKAKKHTELDVIDADPTDERGEPVPKKKKKPKKNKEIKSESIPDPEATDVEEIEDEEAEPKKKSKKTKKKIIGGSDEVVAEEGEDSSQKEKPRIKIKLGADIGWKGKKVAKKAPSKPSKRSRPDEEDEEGVEKDIQVKDDTEGLAPRPKRSKKEAASGTAPRQRTRKAAETESGAGSTRSSRALNKPSAKSVPDSVYLDVAAWKLARDHLNGSFDEARKLFTKYGPWKLPAPLEDSFPEIALSTLAKMNSKDKYKVFASAVSDSDAPDYSDIVKKPMDFGRMKEKVEEGMYGKGSAAAAAFYGDFMLVFDNCRLYNTDESEVTEEAARLLAYLPEAYVGSCIAVLKKGK